MKTIIKAVLVSTLILSAGSVANAQLGGSEWGYGKNQFVGFRPGGKVWGNGGCNRFFGRFKITDGKLYIGPLALTRRACAPAIMKSEQSFLRKLQAARAFKFTHIRLRLYLRPGRLLLDMRRRDWD